MGLNFKFQKLQMTFYINKLNRLLIIKKGSQTQVINFMMIISHGTGFEILKITNDF